MTFCCGYLPGLFVFAHIFYCVPSEAKRNPSLSDAVISVSSFASESEELLLKLIFIIWFPFLDNSPHSCSLSGSCRNITANFPGVRLFFPLHYVIIFNKKENEVSQL